MEHYQGKYNTVHRKRWPLAVFLLLGAAAICAGVILLPPLVEKLMLEPVTEITIEAGTPVPSPYAFLPEEAGLEISYAGGTGAFDTNVPGDHAVTLSMWKGEFPSTIHVVDTTPPTGEVRNLTSYQTNIPSAQDFVIRAEDLTAVTVELEAAPDPTLDGDQTVVIRLTDTSGNVTRLPAVLTVIVDQEGPAIDGVRDITLYQGGTVAYRSGVTVTDNRDDAPELSIDSSAVDLTTPGVYEVVYTASDGAGNVSEARATVTVLEKRESYVELDEIYDRADEILATIVNDTMSDEEKVTAIYQWIRGHCGYSNHSEKDDWRQAAYRMMKSRSGDCFNYFSLCKLMLERLEIPNIDVVKVKNYPSDSMHYWSLVSVDGGETYYHVDTTPRIGGGEFCLVTDRFMDNYSAAHSNCFNRDKSLYPATPGS